MDVPQSENPAQLLRPQAADASAPRRSRAPAAAACPCSAAARIWAAVAAPGVGSCGAGSAMKTA